MTFLLIYIEIRDTFVKDYTGGYSEGAASICTYLRSLGHRVHLLHLTRTNQVDPDHVLNEIARINPDLIGFSVMSPSFWAARRLNNEIKEALNIKTIIGGPHAMFRHSTILAEESFDFVAIGEGERLLPPLLLALEGRPYDKAKIPGVLARGAATSEIPPGACYVQDLDALPAPDRSFFDFPNLRESKERQAYVVAGRGCPFQCTYCPNLFKRKLLGFSKLRHKSPSRLIQEISDLLRDYPFIQLLVFQDDFFPVQKRWILPFAGLYKAKIGKPFTCNIHPKLISDELCSILADMGCRSIMTGVESGSERIRRNILLRDISNESLREKVATCRKYGIGVSTYNMMGHPSETLEEAISTIKLNAELNPAHSFCTIVIPYPGTALNEKCLNEKGFGGEREPQEYPEFTETPIMRCDKMSPEQVIFLKKYFNILKQLYRFMPWWLLDRMITHKRFPYALSNRAMNWARPKLIHFYLTYVARVYNRYLR